MHKKAGGADMHVVETRIPKRIEGSKNSNTRLCLLKGALPTTSVGIFDIAIYLPNSNIQIETISEKLNTPVEVLFEKHALKRNHKQQLMNIQLLWRPK